MIKSSYIPRIEGITDPWEIDSDQEIVAISSRMDAKDWKYVISKEIPILPISIYFQSTWKGRQDLI